MTAKAVDEYPMFQSDSRGYRTVQRLCSDTMLSLYRGIIHKEYNTVLHHSSLFREQNFIYSFHKTSIIYLLL